MAKKWTEQEIEILKRCVYYKSDERYKMLPNRTKSSIITKMYDMKIYSKNRKLSDFFVHKRKTKNKQRIDDILNNSFLTVDSPQIAYLLGIIWGDGSLYNGQQEGRKKYIYLGILTSDFDDIKNIFDENWRIKNRVRKNRKKSITEAINHNSNFSAFLYKNDYNDKSVKSPTNILQKIPENLKHYFWRGYSDADGCFYVSKSKKCFQYALAGSYQQDWKEFEKLLQKLDIKYTLKKSILKTSKYSVIRFCKKADFIKFGDYIYKGEQFGLKRKYNKFIMAIPNTHEYPHT